MAFRSGRGVVPVNLATGELTLGEAKALLLDTGIVCLMPSPGGGEGLALECAGTFDGDGFEPVPDGEAVRLCRMMAADPACGADAWASARRGREPAGPLAVLMRGAGCWDVTRLAEGGPGNAAARMRYADGRTGELLAARVGPAPGRGTPAQAAPRRCERGCERWTAPAFAHPCADGRAATCEQAALT